MAGRRFIIAFGGDGTISEVARGILSAETDTELGVLPHGTGSDFVRSLELPSRLGDAAATLSEGRTVWMDVGNVSFRTSKGDTETRDFINSSSFGLSGDVTESTNRSSKSLGGFVSFASSTIKSAFTFDHPDVFLEVDDEPARRLPITTVCFNNGRYFGGGMKIAPDASMVDGRLDLIVVRKLSFGKILAQGPRLYAGAHLSLPEVHHRLATTARAWPAGSDVDVLLEVDGESPGTLPAQFQIRPKALRVRIPNR
jgi:YegS/Rv2252/BmrU family lipid kinase